MSKLSNVVPKVTLGVAIASSGSWEKQAEILANKAVNWSKHLCESRMIQAES